MKKTTVLLLIIFLVVSVLNFACSTKKTGNIGPEIGQGDPAALDEVERDDEQREPGEQLVGRAEELPEGEPGGLAIDLVEGEEGDCADRQTRGQIAVAERPDPQR